MLFENVKPLSIQHSTLYQTYLRNLYENYKENLEILDRLSDTNPNKKINWEKDGF